MQDKKNWQCNCTQNIHQSVECMILNNKMFRKLLLKVHKSNLYLLSASTSHLYLLQNWNWDKITKELSEIPWETVNNIPNPHQCLEELNKEIYEVCIKYVPQRQPGRSYTKREHRRIYRIKPVSELLENMNNISQRRKDNWCREITELEEKLKLSYQTAAAWREQKAAQDTSRNLNTLVQNPN